MKKRLLTVKVPNAKTGKIFEIRMLDYIQNFLYIRPKSRDLNAFLESGEEDDTPLVLFKLNDDQMKFYLQIEEDWANYRPIEYAVLKARQKGFSTLIAAILFSRNIYSPYRESLIIADKDDHTSRIFEMYQRFYDHLPEDIKPSLNSNKRGTVISTKSESTISVETVSDDLARGATLLGAHASEFAMWRKQKESLASLLSAVPFSPDAMLFIESTAKGMNEFRELFNSAYSGKNKRIRGWFSPWYTSKEYKLPYNGEELYRSGAYDDEVSLYENYKDKGMTLEGLMWRRAQIDAMGLEMFHQEYPTYPDEAFLSTGVSVFNTHAVQKRLEEVNRESPKRTGYFTYKQEWNSSGSRVSVSDIKFIDDPDGDVTIYEEPYAGYPYVIGADPAGLNGKDFFVAQVLRHDGNCRKQVAMFRRQKMDPDEFGMQLYCLGQYYNTALIGVETNTGQNANKRLAQAGYRKIYVRQNQQSFEEDVLNQYGVSTQASNKNDMINTLKERFRERPEEFNDKTTLQEMMTFVVLDIGSRGNYILGAATPSDHDDTVMALAIAHTIALTNQQTTSVNMAEREKAGLPWQLRSERPKNSTQGRGLWKKSIVS